MKVNGRLDRKFRELAMHEFGFVKGALNRAAEEATLLCMPTMEKA
ncbi:MAG: hypothetical protein QW158_05485 [Nitrososphaerales archaeon]